MSPYTRRRALQAIGVTTAGAVAGCSGTDGSTVDDPVTTRRTTGDPTSTTDGSTTTGPTIDLSPGPVTWGQYRADAGNTGVSAVASLSGDPVAGDWSLSPDADPIGTYSAVARASAVYTATLHEVDDGPGELRVRCHRLDDGAEAWTTPIERPVDGAGGPRSIPLIALTESALLVSSVPLRGDGELLAFDPRNGSILWRTDAPMQLSPHDGVVYGSTVANGGGPPRLTGIDPDGGSQVWSPAVPDEYVPVPSSGGIAVDDESFLCHVLDGADRRRVAAWAPDGGDRRWVTEPIPGPQYGTPLALDDGVAITVAAPDDATTAYLGVDAASGALTWSYEVAGRHGGGPTVVDGTAYLVTFREGAGDREVTLHAVDVGSGERAYTTPLPSTAFGNPVSDGDRLVVAGTGFTALDPADGTELWRATPAGDGTEMGQVVPVDEGLLAHTGGEAVWTLFR